jgi:carboxymethylenebutenolidase
MYDAVLAETVTIGGHQGDAIEAYVARPLRPGPLGGVVVLHHMPGYDRSTKEITRRFASEGLAAVCPNLFYREAPGAEPDDAAAAVRAAGGVPDERLVGDVVGAVRYLRGISSSNGRVGIIGFCSGGRQALLAACTLELQAAVDCYGAFVTPAAEGGPPRRVQPIVQHIPQLSCSLLGLFGIEDIYPTPQEVSDLETALKDAGKKYEFHSYEGAGHAFFDVDRPSYRVHAATDGWLRIREFYGRNLSS